MLQIIVPAKEYFDESIEEFVYTKQQKLCLEHSLISISKWESKYHKAFLSDDKKTDGEILYYIKCMTLNSGEVDDLVYKSLTRDNITKISEYINDPMTATTIKHTEPTKKNHEILTSEILYYDMIACNIPFECEKWHLNRLIKLIEVCGIKSQPTKKMSKAATGRSNKSLNAARRNAMHTRG